MESLYGDMSKATLSDGVLTLDTGRKVNDLFVSGRKARINGLLYTLDRTDKQTNYLKEKYLQDESRKIKEGKFVWLMFKYGEALLPKLRSSTLTRLLFLSTLCDENGLIGSKEEVYNALSLPDSTYYDFLSEATENKALFVTGDNIYIADNVVKYKTTPQDADFTRLFASGIRDIYEHSAPMKHKHIGYVLRIIPYLSRQTNALVYNQTEQVTENLHKITFGEFCKIVGYSSGKINRFADAMLSLKIHGENLIGFMAFSTNPKKWFIVVNPRICYGGAADSDSLTELQSYFAATVTKNPFRDLKNVK